LNTTAALSTAYSTSSPVLCITGQVQSDLIGVGRGALHEVEGQLEMLKYVTKWNARAMTPNEVPIIVHEAFRQLRSGRPQPVEIEIPPDVLQREDDVELRQPLSPDKTAGDPSLLERAAQLLGKAKAPLIIAGGGVLAGEAWEELETVAELLDAPVVMTANGRGSLSDRHPLGIIQLGLSELLPSSDVVLVVGSRGLDFTTNPLRVAPGATLIRIDADPYQLNRVITANVAIGGDSKLALADLAGRIEKHNERRDSRREQIAHLKQVLTDTLNSADPQAGLGLAIRNSVPDDAIIVTEFTQVGYWCRAGLPVYGPRTFIGSGYQGTLGNGFPTALGAKVGNPDKKVVSINGDGGFMFNCQELASAVQHNIGVAIVVFDDGAFGNVRRIQHESFGGRTIASELKNPSFADLGKTFGMPSVRADGADALAGAMREAMTEDGPVMIEVPVGAMPNFQRELREELAAGRSLPSASR
jgi:acetolactate synthase-1/2/3 large subunit